MTAVSKDTSDCRVRRQRPLSYGGTSTEARRTRQSLSSRRTKPLAATSLLVVSVLLTVNLMLVKGISFSSSSATSSSSPSLAPTGFVETDGSNKSQERIEWPLTAASSHRPSPSPTSSPSSKPHNSKHSKKHKKEKSSSSSPSTEAVDDRVERRSHPRRSKDRPTSTTTSAAFGLHRRRKDKHTPNAPAHASSRSGPSRKNPKSRIRPPPETATAKPKAFVVSDDKSSSTRGRKRKHRSSNLNQESSVSRAPLENRPEKPKLSKKKSHHQSKKDRENLGDVPHRDSSTPTEAKQRGTKSTKLTKSSTTKSSKAKSASVDDLKPNSDGLGVKKEKSHKKAKHRSKNANVGGEVATATDGTKLQEDIIPADEIVDSSLEPESPEDSTHQKVTKRKKRKKKISPSSVADEDVTSTALESPEDSVEISPSIDTLTPAETKSKKKKRRRKRASSDKPDEIESTTISNVQLPTVGATDLELEPAEEVGTKDDNEEESVQNDEDATRVTVDIVEATELAPESTTETMEPDTSQLTSEESVDPSAEPEIEVNKSSDEITTEISAHSNVEEKEDENVEEAVSVEDDMVEQQDDLAELNEEEPKDVNADDEVVETIDNEEEDIVAKEETVHEGSEDVVDQEEEGVEMVEEKSSHADSEIIVDESISEEKNIENDNDDMTGHQEEETAVIGEEESREGSQVNDGEPEEAKDIMGQEEENAEANEQDSGEVNSIDNESVEEDEDVDEPETTEVAEERAIQVDEDIDDDESKIDINEENADASEVVQESSPKVDVDVTEQEPILEESNDEAEITESEDDENPNGGNEEENETHRGVSVYDQADQDVSSSESSDIDPEQDVVSFIEEVLHENVRSWIDESDSHFETIVNKTRGGHSDIAIDFEENDKSEIVEKDCKVTIQDSKESLEETKRELRIVDRDSLEKSEDKDSDAVVSVVTWNLAEESPQEEDAAFIRKFRKNGVLPNQGSDLVLISGQECENIKPRRSEGRRSREYRRLMIKMLGKGYVPLALHLLGGIQFGLFAKRSFLEEIESVKIADVTCGIGNVLHNKGAIAAFVKVKARNQIGSDKDKKRSKSLRMVFVAAHLAAHVKNAEARDADFWRISSELEAQAPEGFLPRKKSNGEPSGSFLFDSCDRVFFCGDLNYRLDLPRELTEHAILHGDNDGKVPIKDLLRHDQLIHTMAEGRAFPGFGEGKITFMPTFKYDKESSSYDTSHKQRIPAWTDRILFQPANDIRVLDYQSVPDAQHSDHRPVYGSYRIGMEGRVISPSPRKKKRKQLHEPTNSNYY